MKKLLLIFLLFSSITQAVTIDLTLRLTGHEPITKQLTFNDPKEHTWRIDAGKIIISGTIPDQKSEAALIAFNIFLQQEDKKYKLISSPSIKAAWGEKAELSIATKEADKETWSLLLDIVVTP